MLERLKQEVLEANLQLVTYNLVVFTWGNVSALDSKEHLIVIKPSGVDYQGMTADQMVVVDLDGNILEGGLRPSSDLKTHLELYKAFPAIRGVVHTHSRYATAFAQAEQNVPCYGTTHADYFFGEIPCTRALTDEEIQGDYEKNTGMVIAETLQKRSVDPMAAPGILVCKHGPFAWGKSAMHAVANAAYLEEVARLALLTRTLDAAACATPQSLLDKHYYRKHGAEAYYGQ